jgi:hypothetical protein
MIKQGRKVDDMAAADLDAAVDPPPPTWWIEEVLDLR